MKIFRILILTLSLLLCVASVPINAQSPLNDQICNGVQDSTFCDENEETKNATPDSNSLYGPNGVITKIVSILSMVIGVAAVIMIIVGGIRYVTSSGDPNNTNGAKNTIIYALAGLLVALFAQAIIIFVISKL